jgi:hypothetical protein
MKMFIEISFQQVRITNLGEFVPNGMGGLQRAEGSYTEHVYEMCVQPKLKKVLKERCVNVQFDNI